MTDEVARNGALSRINFGQRFFLGAPCLNSAIRLDVLSPRPAAAPPQNTELRPSPSRQIQKRPQDQVSGRAELSAWCGTALEGNALVCPAEVSVRGS